MLIEDKMSQNAKTILDILLERNRLTRSEVATFDRNLTSAEIENKLRGENLVSSEDIVKAYAVLYNLPFIRLENYKISSNALELIPKELVEKYSIVAFDEEGSTPGGKIKIAMGKPGQLRTNPPEILEELKNRKGVAIDLFITTPEDINKVVGHYLPKTAEQVPEIKQIDRHIQYGKTAQLKTVDLKNYRISFETISKFPIEISKKYKMVIFDSPSPQLIRIAVSDPYDPRVQEILDFVREKNEIAIEEFVAPPADIMETIELYYRKPEPLPTPPPKVQPSKSIQPPHAPPKISPVYSASQPKVVPQSKVTTAPIVRPHFIARPETAMQEEAAESMTAISQESYETDLDKFLGVEVKDIEVLKQIAQSGNVPQILAAAIALATLKKASDIHIEPEEKFLRIRFRVDGVLKDIIKMPLELQPALISRIKILARLKIDEQRIPQDGRFDVKTHGHEIDLRVSTLPTVRGEKAALRILDKTQNIYSFDQLGIAGRNLKILQENIKKPFGVILACGPTGSGKSTTLYSILKVVSSPEVNVITLEDPVEYEMPGINQCQVKPKIGFSFAEGLRSVLRQDPNIIMVGEIRDAETAGMATHAALTGHLVLTTLHTNDAAGALPRLTNMGIEPFLITSSINVIIGQRLVRKICSKCKKETKLPEPLISEISKEINKFNLPKPFKFYEGSGCPECNQGYLGRIGIFEVLTMSDKIEEAAIKRRPASEILQAAVEEGMVTMKQDGLIKAVKGITTISEVLRVTTSG